MAQSPRLNLVLMISDDQSAANLGCYGDKLARTPNLDKLANQGTRFTRAYCTSPQCSPSRATMLTGRYPHEVGASRLAVNVLPDFLPTTLVAQLKAQGYYTVAIGKVHQTGIQDQFDQYLPKLTLAAVTDFFANRPKDRPFFLWVGSTDPHRPYKNGTFSPPTDPKQVIVPNYLVDTPGTRQDLSWYYDAIARLDQQCGWVLDALTTGKLDPQTVSAFTSDNGLPFARAKASLYEAGVRLPLLIRQANGSATLTTKQMATSDSLVSLLDLPRTLLDLVGVAAPERWKGRSLRPLLEGKSSPQPPYQFLERNWHDTWSPARGVVSTRYKFIVNYRPEATYLQTLDKEQAQSWMDLDSLNRVGKLRSQLADFYFKSPRPMVELYDMQTDPGEWRNLADDPAHASVRQQMQQALQRWMRETGDFLPPPTMMYQTRQYESLNATQIGPKKPTQK
ncbi:MAG: sulfatase [Bacteroidetes bacterium]|nr:sulfatase [Fibrella sp.]